MPDFFPGFTRRRIETSGASINLVTGGSGPPLLLLHGYPQTHAMWRKVAPRLAEAPWRRLARNAALWAVNALLSPLVVLPVSSYAAAHALDWRPAWWSGAAGLGCLSFRSDPRAGRYIFPFRSTDRLRRRSRFPCRVCSGSALCTDRATHDGRRRY